MQGVLTRSDSQLLQHYVAEQDSAAFRELVMRHGPGVLRVCRFVLRDSHEADDAFQATFLVLVRRAPSIRDPDALSRWLRGVAYRVSMRARRRAMDRHDHERKRSEMCPTEIGPAEPNFEVRQLLHDELNRLPEHYAAPLLLCYFEGLTHQEAAKQLGWPVGTVKIRLVRARTLLRERLGRRGVTLSLAFLLLSWTRASDAAVSSTLVDSTVSAMAGACAVERALQGMSSSHAAPADGYDRHRHFGPFATRFLAVSILVLLAGIAGRTFATNHFAPPIQDAAAFPANLTDVLAVDCR